MNPDYDKSNYLSDYFSFQCLNKKITFVKTAPLEFFLMIGKFNSIYLRSCTELILFFESLYRVDSGVTCIMKRKHTRVVFVYEEKLTHAVMQ
jgi:hypothetical protein